MKILNIVISFFFVVGLMGCIDDNVIDIPILPPNPVKNLVALEGDQEVKLTWDISTTEKITEYEITYTPDGTKPILLPSDKDTYTVTGLTNDTEYTFTIFAKNDTQASDGVSVKATPFAPNTAGPELLSFAFMSASNPKMALESEDIKDLNNAVIDQDNNAVTFSADDISAYVYIDALVPTFTVETGATVMVGGEEQISGVTPQDFTNPVQFEISLDGKTRIYTVTVNKSKYATIPDAEFVTRLKDMGMPFDENNKLDITSDAVINLAADGKINLDGDGKTTLIENLKGIEFFVNAKEIDCERNNITYLNISRNEGLKNLVSGGQPLNDLVVGEKSDLEILYLNGTKITQSELQPVVDNNLGLKRLYLHGTPTVTQIDVTKSTSLQRLRLSESTAVNSASFITAMLAANSNSVDIRIYSEDGTTQCGSYDPSTYKCQ